MNPQIPEQKKKVVLRWLKKAGSDLTVVKHLIGIDNPPTDVLCFHCQQAIEKYLKAYLTFRDVRVKKIHDDGSRFEGGRKVKKDKFKIPNHKYQIPNKSQIPNSNVQNKNGMGGAGLNNWNLNIVWCLVLGAWNLSPIRGSTKYQIPNSKQIPNTKFQTMTCTGLIYQTLISWNFPIRG